MSPQVQYKLVSNLPWDNLQLYAYASTKALMRGVYLDNFVLSVAFHFVSPETFTSGFRVCLCLFQPGKKITIFR